MKATIKQYHYSELSPEDCEAIAAVEHLAFAKYKDLDINLRRVNMTSEQMLESMREENETVFMLYEGDTLMACAHAGIAKDKAGTLFLHAVGLAALPECSKKGYASFLVRAREKWAKKQGAQYARLDTSNRAEETKNFHHACGYKDWYYGHYAGKNYLSIFMRKDYVKPYPTWRRLLRLWYSRLRFRAQYTEYGRLTLLGRLVDKYKKLRGR